MSVCDWDLLFWQNKQWMVARVIRADISSVASEPAAFPSLPYSRSQIAIQISVSILPSSVVISRPVLGLLLLNHGAFLPSSCLFNFDRTIARFEWTIATFASKIIRPFSIPTQLRREARGGQKRPWHGSKSKNRRSWLCGSRLQVEIQ
jgi:hypothetical protein